jgi:hypothetical protein
MAQIYKVEVCGKYAIYWAHVSCYLLPVSAILFFIYCNMKKLLKYLGIAIIGFIGLVVIAVIITAIFVDLPKSDKAESALSSDKKALTYSIADKDQTSRQITYRIVIPERVDDKTLLIDIARKLKKENNWTEKLVCFFEIKVHSESGAWASCAYLPKCSECETDKDADGNPIEHRLIGITKALADSLQQRHLDTINNKHLVAAYIEDIWRCKTELYKVDKRSSKLLMGQLFNNGAHLVQWLTLKKINGQDRYYFDDEEDEDEKNYLILDEGAKTIQFLNKEGKAWQAYGLLEG